MLTVVRLAASSPTEEKRREENQPRRETNNRLHSLASSTPSIHLYILSSPRSLRRRVASRFPIRPVAFVLSRSPCLRNPRANSIQLQLEHSREYLIHNATRRSYLAGKNASASGVTELSYSDMMLRPSMRCDAMRVCR